MHDACQYHVRHEVVQLVSTSTRIVRYLSAHAEHKLLKVSSVHSNLHYYLRLRNSEMWSRNVHAGDKNGSATDCRIRGFLICSIMFDVNTQYIWNYLLKSIFDSSHSKLAVLFCMYLLSLLWHDFRVPLCATVLLLCSLLSLFEFLSWLLFVLINGKMLWHPFGRKPANLSFFGTDTALFFIDLVVPWLFVLLLLWVSVVAATTPFVLFALFDVSVGDDGDGGFSTFLSPTISTLIVVGVTDLLAAAAVAAAVSPMFVKFSAWTLAFVVGPHTSSTFKTLINWLFVLLAALCCSLAVAIGFDGGW